jgi:hypothetical protein
MTNAQIVGLGVRLFAIWLAIYILRQTPGLLFINAREMPDPGAVIVTIAVAIVLLFVCVALWRFPLAVAQTLIPQPTLDQPSRLPVEQLETAAFCLLGLWLLTEALPQAVYVAMIVYHSSKPNAMVTLTPYNYAAIAQMFAELIVGLWLLFGAKGLLGILRWARHAGTTEPSNNRL